MKLETAGSGPRDTRVTLAQQIVAARGCRGQFFPLSFFGEPAWDILLALYAATAAQAKMKVRLTEVAGVPASTVMRWLSHLEAEGFVTGSADGPDLALGRLRLTDKARRAMDSFLGEMISAGAPSTTDD